MADLLAPTDRTRLRRHAERGRYDTDAVYAIVDEAYVAHVGFVVDAMPRVLPMTYGRDGDVLYLHGAVGNAMLRGSSGVEVCVTITLLDGLVLGRSAFHHSMNYRSVVVLGVAQKVERPDAKRRAFDVITDHVVPGRSEIARRANDAEVQATMVLALPLAEASAKVRSGPPIDEAEDLDLAVWAGVIPLSLVPGEPEHDALQVADPALSSLAAPDLPSRGRGA